MKTLFQNKGDTRKLSERSGAGRKSIQGPKGKHHPRKILRDGGKISMRHPRVICRIAQFVFGLCKWFMSLVEKAMRFQCDVKHICAVLTKDHPPLRTRSSLAVRFGWNTLPKHGLAAGSYTYICTVDRTPSCCVMLYKPRLL